MLTTKLVISFIILSIVGHCMGTVFVDNNDIIEQQKIYMTYDMFLFRNFNFQSLGLYNQQCLLANMIYLQKGLFATTIPTKQKTNVKVVLDNLLRIFRSSIGQPFLTHLNAEETLLPVYNQMKLYAFNGKLTDAVLMQELATNVIDKGIKHGLWYTEKEQQLVDAYRYSKSDIISTAMDHCTTSYSLLGGVTKEVESNHLLDLYGESKIFDGIMGKKLLNVDQGFIGFLMSSDEYNDIFVENHEHDDVRFFKVLEIVISALDNIFDGILNVLYTRNIFICDFLGTVELPENPKIQVEILILIQEIFPSIVELSRDVFLLYQLKYLETSPTIFDFISYMTFSEKFRWKWTWLMEKADTFREVAVKMSGQKGSNVNAGENNADQNVGQTPANTSSNVDAGTNNADQNETQAQVNTRSNGNSGENNANGEGQGQANTIGQTRANISSNVDAGTNNADQNETQAQVNTSSNVDEGETNADQNGRQAQDNTMSNVSADETNAYQQISQTESPEDGTTNPGNDHPLKDKVGRLIRNGVVSPSLMSLYGVFNKSWNDHNQNETNTNQNKLLIFELKAWVIFLRKTISFYPVDISLKFPEESTIPDKILHSKIWKQLNHDSKFMDCYNPYK